MLDVLVKEGDAVTAGSDLGVVGKQEDAAAYQRGGVAAPAAAAPAVGAQAAGAEEEEEYYLACERRWVFLMLMLVAGFYGVFTFLLRGGVFCNAQTGNFVFLAIAIGTFQWKQAVYYLLPMSAYLLGTMVSEIIPRPV